MKCCDSHRTYHHLIKISNCCIIALNYQRHVFDYHLLPVEGVNEKGALSGYKTMLDLFSLKHPHRISPRQ